MNIYFGTTHLKTLSDLMRIAEKHGCRINFGFESHSNSDFETGLLKKEKINEKVIGFLEENIYQLENIAYSCDKIWFELREDPENESTKYHTMSYVNENLAFGINESGLTYQLADEDRETQELIQDFLDNTDYENFYSFSDSPTIIYGFGNKEKVADYRVYRSGMALKYFADLVCDYLEEPRIERVY